MLGWGQAGGPSTPSSQAKEAAKPFGCHGRARRALRHLISSAARRVHPPRPSRQRHAPAIAIEYPPSPLQATGRSDPDYRRVMIAADRDDREPAMGRRGTAFPAKCHRSRVPVAPWLGVARALTRTAKQVIARHDRLWLRLTLPFLPRSALGAVQRRFIAASSQLAPRCHAGLKKKQGAKLMQHSLVAAVVGGLMCLAASTFATQAAPPLATPSVEPKAGLVQAVEYPYHRRHHHHYRRHHHVFQHHWRYDHWRHDHWRHHYWRHHHHRRHHHHD